MNDNDKRFVSETQKICEEYEKSLMQLRERLQNVKPHYCENHPMINLLDPVIKYVSVNSGLKYGNSNLSN